MINNQKTQQIFSTSFQLGTAKGFKTLNQSVNFASSSVSFYASPRGKRYLLAVVRHSRQQPFIVTPTTIVQYVESLSEIEVIVLNLLLFYQRAHGYCTVSLQTLAQRTCYSVRHVQRVMDKLKAMDLVRLVMHRYNNSNVYILNDAFDDLYVQASLGDRLSAFLKFRKLGSLHLLLHKKTAARAARKFARLHADNADADANVRLNINHSRDLKAEASNQAIMLNKKSDFQRARAHEGESMQEASTIFSVEQLKELAELPREAVAHGHRRLTAALAAGKNISNKFSYLKAAAEGWISDQHKAAALAREPLAQDSAGASSKGSSGHTEAASKALSARESVRYEASDLPYLKETCESTAKIVAESSRTYVKAQTEINLRLLDAAKRNHSFFMRKFHETCKAFSIDPATVKTRHEMLPPAPLNATGAIFAKELGALMPDSVKEELNALRKSTPDHKEIKNNVVLHSILDAYESGKLVQQSIIGNDMPSAKPTILRE